MKKMRELYVVLGALGLLGMYAYALFTRTHAVFFGERVIRFHLIPLLLENPLCLLAACLFAGLAAYGVHGLIHQ